MLHSCTPAANKKSVLESFQQEDGAVRLLIATIAFGMGIDCKGVKRIIHYRPSKNVEAFVQETGRAGRACDESVAFLLYHGILLNHVHSDIKYFIKTKECRRMTLVKHFNADTVTIEVPHKCCDICAASCACEWADCSTYSRYPTLDVQNVNERTSQLISVSAHSKKLHKTLVLKFLDTTANGEVRTLTNLHFMFGFSEHQISQVLENVTSIFTLSEIYKSVEVWDKLWRVFLIKIQFITRFYKRPSVFNFNVRFIQPRHSFFNFDVRFIQPRHSFFNFDIHFI